MKITIDDIASVPAKDRPMLGASLLLLAAMDSGSGRARATFPEPLAGAVHDCVVMLGELADDPDTVLQLTQAPAHEGNVLLTLVVVEKEVASHGPGAR